LKIAFFGLPLAALLLNADGHDLVYAGICRRSVIGTRRLKKKLGARVSIVPNLADEKVSEKIRKTKPDLLVSWFWTKKIPKAILDVAPLGAIGIHPSLLPRHRGPDPYFWAIDSGDEKTGVTAHYLDEEYDTGKILAQRELAIDPSWNGWTLAKKMDRPSLALLRQIVGDFAAGKIPKGRAQDEALATEAPAPTDDDLEISFQWPAEKIVRRVRAASPWPGAFFYLGDGDDEAMVTLVDAAVTKKFPQALLPGEAAVVDGDVVVRVADHAIRLISARMDDHAEDGSEAFSLDEKALALLFDLNV
jgi:methionyl-tRNA formyltransferase